MRRARRRAPRVASQVCSLRASLAHNKPPPAAMTRANNTATSGKTRSSSIFAWSLGAVCILAFVASV